MRRLGATASQDELGVARPHARVEPHPCHGSATEAEQMICAEVGIAQHEELVELLTVLVADQGFARRKCDDYDANLELIDLVKHLDQVLAARQSGKVAQEDHERRLAGQRRKRNGSPGRVRERKVGQPVAG